MSTPTAKDKQDFFQAEKVILGFMSDGRWHSASSIINVAGQREGLRRMRNLRKQGFVIAKRRSFDDSREYDYRITNLEQKQP